VIAARDAQGIPGRQTSDLLRNPVGLQQPLAHPTLQNPAIRQQRRAMLAMPHMVPLAAYAADLRSRPDARVPDFDPLDGGVEAQVLFLLEKPGPRAVPADPSRDGYGFVSRDNDGATADAVRRFMAIAGLPRDETVIWNAIPWWNGSIAVTAAERTAGLLELPRLLRLLPRLHTAVLVGRNAARARPVLGTLRVLESAHPSPQVRAGNRALWDAIPGIWRLAAEPPGPGRP